MIDRVDFNAKTKRIIAGRSGYRCSYPGCRRVTIGPGAASDKIATIGVAAHVFAASPAGPRGQDRLTAEELRSAENGIWLCATHATMVDNNRGDKHPASLLLSYKAAHEARISRELGEIGAPFGWIQELVVHRGPVFNLPAVVRFAKATIVVGNNGTGKTALCEWIAGITEPSLLQRWLSQHPGGVPLRYELKYSDPTEHTVELSTEEGEIRFVVDGDSAPYNPVPFNAVFLRDPPGPSGRPTIKRLATQLGVDPLIVRNLASMVSSNPRSLVQDAEIERDSVIVELEGRPGKFTLGQLSAAEQVLVIFEFAISLAHFSSAYRPTILILDAFVGTLDAKALAYFLHRLQSQEYLFQTIVTAVPRMGRLPWAGWEQILLSGSPPSVVAELVGGAKLRSE